MGGGSCRTKVATGRNQHSVERRKHEANLSDSVVMPSDEASLRSYWKAYFRSAIETL